MLKQTIIFSAILIVFISWWLLRFKIRYWAHLLMERGWKSSVHYDRCRRIFDQVYEDVNPYAVSLKEREDKDLKNDNTYVYGEVKFFSFAQILEMAEPKPGEVFYDLGSGGGKGVFIAGLVFDFSKALGVEKLDSLYALSNSLVDKLSTIATVKELPAHKKINIQFIHSDMLDVDISDADIVFINATCFKDKLWDGIVAKLLNLKVGSRVILTSKDLNVGGFKLKHRNMYLMSWGLSQVSIYERI